SARSRPPADAKLKIAGVRQKLAVTGALAAAGKYKEALPPAQAAADEARAVGWSPLTADALNLLSHGQNRAQDYAGSEKSAREAAREALAGSDDRALLRAWGSQLWALSQIHGRYAEAMELAATALSGLERLRGAERDQAGTELHNSLGV